MLNNITDPLFYCVGVCIGYFGTIKIRQTNNAGDFVAITGLGIIIGSLLQLARPK